VERPPHYDTFGEFHYAYHYGDMYVPYIKQEEPLKSECQHFLDCIREGISPLTNGHKGLELVQILEASSLSLQQDGASVDLPGAMFPDDVDLEQKSSVSGPACDQELSGGKLQESVVRA